MTLKTTWGEDLYTLRELAQKSNTPIKQLSKWFRGGELASFITTYENQNGKRMYRWGTPLPWEKPKQGSTFIYPLETVVTK